VTNTIQYQNPQTTGKGSRPWPWKSFFVWLALWLIPGLLMLGAIAGAANSTSFAPVLAIMFAFPGGIALLLFVPIAVNFMVRRIRLDRGRAVLGHVEQAIGLNLPLVRYLASAQVSEKRKLRARLFSLNECLSKGMSVVASLRETTPEIPERTIGILAAAENSGRLKEVLHRELQRDNTSELPRMDTQIFNRFYPMLSLMFIIYIVTGIAIFVIPKFKEIFRDFRTPLSQSMENLLWWSEFIVGDMGLLTPLIILAVGVFMIGPIVIDTFLPRERKLLPLASLRDRIFWHTPLLHRASQSRNFADFFYSLSESFAAGRPADQALLDAGRIPFNSVLSDRILGASVMVQSGTPLSVAFAHIGFPVRVCEMLATAAHADTLPETCKFLADIYASRHSRFMLLLRSATQVGMTLLLGYIVYHTMLPIISSLVKLLESVVGGSTRGVL
jgi:type IV pilus assembly protein PilC